MSRWRAVVFDLDDTLYPERQYVQSGMHAVAAWIETQLGVPAGRTFAELCALQETAPRGRTFDRWLQGHGLEAPAWLPGMLLAYRRHQPRLTPFAETPRVLERLSSRFTLGLVSDGYREVQRRKWAALGLQPYFQAVVFSDELGRDAWKPSPLPFETVLEALAVAADRAVYVGDNPTKDFRGAGQVGMGTIRVRRPLRARVLAGGIATGGTNGATSSLDGSATSRGLSIGRTSS